MAEGTDIVGDAFGNLLLSVLFKVWLQETDIVGDAFWKFVAGRDVQSLADGTDIVGDACVHLLLSVLLKVWLMEQISSRTSLGICC